MSKLILGPPNLTRDPQGTVVQHGHYRCMDLGLEQLQFRESRSSRLWRGIARLTHGTALADVLRNNFVVAVLKGHRRAVGAPQLVRSAHDTSDLDPA